MVFDAIILALTLAKLKANSTTGVGYVVYRDSVVYFVAASITNTVVLAIEALPSRYEILKPAVVPFSTIITVTMGARVFLNLKLLHQRQARAQQGLPVTGSSSFNTTNKATPLPRPPVLDMYSHSPSSEKTSFERPFRGGEYSPSHTFVTITRETVVSR